MRKKWIITIVIITLLLVPAFLFPFGRENWPTYMGNQYLTGNNDGIIPEGGEIVWTFAAPGHFFNPVGVNERVYVVSTDNYLYCLDMRDGSLLWSFKSESPLTRMVVVYRGRVYLPAGRFLYCLDEKTGEVIWGRRDPSFGFYGTPTIAAGKIFYGNRKGFYARELVNGHLLWENMNIYTYGGFPTYWNGMVYTVSKEFQEESARLVALNQDDGSVLWGAFLPNVSNIYSPVLYDEKIYLAFEKQLLVFDARSGKKILEKPFPEPVASHPVFAQGWIFLSLFDGRIIKIDPETGDFTTLYTAPHGTQFAMVGSYLFIPVKEQRGGYVIVDSATGLEETRIRAGRGEPSSLTVSNGMTFLPAQNTLLAIGRGRFFTSLRTGPEEGKQVGQAQPGTIRTEPGSAGGIETKEAAGEEQYSKAGVGAEKKGKLEGGEGYSEPGSGEVKEEELAGEVGYAGPGRKEEKEEVVAEEEEPEVPTVTVKGKVKDSETQKPLSGRVEATTRFKDGDIVINEEQFGQGEFEIDVPKEGETYLIVSSPGYAFQTIMLPDEEAIDNLTTEPLELSLPRAAKGASITIDSIQYRVESANLEPDSIPTLIRILEMMEGNPGLRIEIAGHTDSTGTKEFNQKLSENRAESVASWLIQNGILSTRITTLGYGEARPVADNETDEGRRKNRRTEIKIMSD
jgi:outer membrane protein OmpA-like peptidoglycan-associated protein/outer membrane protein assembly factor BamB